MPSALREALFAQGASRTLVKGEILFTRRDPSDAVYFVRTGSLEALDDRSRPPAVLATLGPSSVVGEVAFIDGAPRAATVQACEPTTLLAWSREALLALAESVGVLPYNVSRDQRQGVASRLREPQKGWPWWSYVDVGNVGGSSRQSVFLGPGRPPVRFTTKQV